MPWGDVLSSYFCNIFERCHAHAKRGEKQEGKEAQVCCPGGATALRSGEALAAGTSPRLRERS